MIGQNYDLSNLSESHQVVTRTCWLVAEVVNDSDMTSDPFDFNVITILFQISFETFMLTDS